MPERPEYILGSSEAERERLTRQSAAHEAEAIWLLDQIGVQPGWRAVDVGCGPLGILNLLSDRVGPMGVVVGLDNEPRMIELARRSVAALGLQNVQLIQGEAASSGLPRASFDCAHARLVLINVPNPQEVLREMAALVRPGGVVAVEDVDWISWTCEPSHPAWDRLISILTAVRRARGLDVFIGRRVPGMLRRLGLVDVHMKAFAPIWRPGDLHHNLPIVFAGLHKEQIIESGLCTEAELADLTHALGDHLNHPDTFVVYSLLFQTWAIKPVHKEQSAC
jgi:SAM-dependent methyltransferase